MTTLGHELAVGGSVVAVMAWLPGFVSYLRMMRTVPEAVARLHMARLRVRANLLCFAAPELFTGSGAPWRRVYLSSLALFGVAIVAAVAGSTLPSP